MQNYATYNDIKIRGHHDL